MKRERKWTWRVARGLAIAAIVVLGLWLGLGRTIIERVIASQFEGFGLPKPKLGALLALIPGERATGVGSLDGKLPVTIGRWPSIHFGDGELRTAPGQFGWFKVKDTEALGTVLESADPRFQADSLYVEIKKRLVNAFKDFEYDELSVVLTKDGGGKFVARVNTKGRARTGERQEFEEVTLNFLDFDQTLRDVILKNSNKTCSPAALGRGEPPETFPGRGRPGYNSGASIVLLEFLISRGVQALK